MEIEHILPDQPKTELVEDFKQKNPGADYGVYKVKLGNLTLLEKPLNIIAGNDFFANKKAKYLDCRSYLTRSIVRLADGGQNSSISRINVKLKAFDEWCASSIDQRQALLVELAAEIWRVVPI